MEKLNIFKKDYGYNKLSIKQEIKDESEIKIKVKDTLK